MKSALLFALIVGLCVVSIKGYASYARQFAQENGLPWGGRYIAAVPDNADNLYASYARQQAQENGIPWGGNNFAAVPDNAENLYASYARQFAQENGLPWGGRYFAVVDNSDNSDELDDDMLDIDEFSFVRGTYKALKISLRTVKGLHCTVQAAVNMRNAAQKAKDDVLACGGILSKQAQTVINSCNNIINTVNNIVTLQECKTENENTNEDSKVSNSCFVKMLKATNSLKKQIRSTVNQIKKVPSAAKGGSACVTDAFTELSRVLTSYPTFVANCSKLVS